MKTATLTGIVLVSLSLLTDTAMGQETDEDLVKQLEGQAGKPKMRSLSRSGKSAPARKKATRSLTFKGRGVPKHIEAAEKSGNLRVKQVDPINGEVAESKSKAGTGGAMFVVTYDVDPDSQVTRRSILFKVDSTEFTDANSVVEIAKLARALKNPRLANFLYVIEGHSSAEGPEDHNRELSQKRADAIVDRLIRFGVNPGQLIPVGHGEAGAKFPETAPDEKLAQDRRVEIFRLEE